MVYRDVVPSGTIDLQNLSVGDVIKRAWSLYVNRPARASELTTARKSKRNTVTHIARTGIDTGAGFIFDF
jgi:hypothetical protein